MNVKYLLKFLIISILFVAAFNFSSKAQFGDYSVQINVDNIATGHHHDVNVVFTNDFFGGTPTNGFDACCDSYALPPAFGQPMVYTSITEAPFPSGANEIQFNTRPPLTADWSVPLGFFTGAGSIGDYVLTFDWIYTVPGNIGIELEDLQLGVTQDLLLDTTYEFSGTFSDPEARFMIHFTFGGACPTPQEPTFLNTSQTETRVLWTCNTCIGSETFLIEYGQSGFTPGSGNTPGIGGTIVDPATSGITLTGLSSSTEYDFYIRTNCGSSYSDNSPVGSVTTLDPPCAEPEAVVVANITATSAEVSWTCTGCTGSESFLIEYGPIGFTPGTGQFPGAGGSMQQAASSPQTITGLTAGTEYDLYVRTQCGSIVFSDNTIKVTFTPVQPECHDPSGLNILSTTSTSANIEWACISCPGGAQFELEYGPTDFHITGDPSFIVSPVTSVYTLTGLIAGTGYSVRIRTICDGGLFSDYSEVVDIRIQGSCDADFSVGNSSTCVNTNVSFIDASTGASSWLWDFGDGSTSNLQNPIHVYQDTGVFDVSLTISDGATCNEDTIVVAAVNVAPPIAAFTASPILGCSLPHTVSFTNQSILPDTWNWDFGDGTSSTNQNPTHDYIAAGTFEAVLTVIDTVAGCSDTASTIIEVAESAVASFTYTVAGSTFTFTNTSTTGASYYWDFGDGNNSTTDNPIHTYAGQANYTVTLIVTNSCGSDTTTQIVSTLTVGITDNPGLTNVVLFPNPTNGIIRLSGKLQNSLSTLNIAVLDAQGRVVMKDKVRSTSGSISIDMNLTDLSDGIYQLEIDGNGWTSNHRISLSR